MEKVSLKDARGMAGFTQKDLSSKSGLSLATVKRVEHGNLCSIRTANKLVAALNDGFKSTKAPFRATLFNLTWNIESLPSGTIALSNILNEKVGKKKRAKK